MEEEDEDEGEIGFPCRKRGGKPFGSSSSLFPMSLPASWKINGIVNAENVFYCSHFLGTILAWVFASLYCVGRRHFENAAFAWEK